MPRAQSSYGIEETLQAVNGLQFAALLIAAAWIYRYAIHEKLVKGSQMEKTVPYSEELYAAVMESMLDYWQLGETVCGAEDPAVITVSEELGKQYPEFKGLTTVRVNETYVSPWKSDTYLSFSNIEITGTEYQAADDYLGEDK